MDWFDGFTKALADRATRATMLKRAGQAAAGAVVAQWTPAVALAREKRARPLQTAGPFGSAAGQPATRAIRPQGSTRAVVHKRTNRAQSSLMRSGPCTLQRTSNGFEFAFTTSTLVGGKTLQLAIRHTIASDRSGGGAGTIHSTMASELTLGGAPLLTVGSNFAAAAGTKRIARRGTVSMAYGAAARGFRNATFQVDGSQVSGNVDGRAIGSMTTARLGTLSTGPLATKFSVDPALARAVTALGDRAKAQIQTCGLARTPVRHALLRRKGEAAGIELTAERAGGAVQIASYQQLNVLSNDSPACESCLNTVFSALGTCVSSALASAFFCPPCAAAAFVTCCTAGMEAEGDCFIPSLGGCCEKLCSGSAFSCCDKADTCCGTEECCASNEVCSNPNGGQTGSCCPRALPVSCGNYNCCAQGTTCCGSSCCGAGNFCADPNNYLGQCCPNGTTKCGNSCCPSGLVCSDTKSELCCPANNNACGPTCCPSNMTCLDAQRGICCGPGLILCGNQCCSSGSCLNRASASAVCCSGPVCGDRCCSLIGPTPRPHGNFITPPPTSPGRIQTCLRPHVPCHSLLNGQTYTTCCSPKQICCGDQCCSNGTTCCADPQGNPRCANCIR